MTLTIADMTLLRMDLARAECDARRDHAERWRGQQTLGVGTPSPEEYADLLVHTRHWDARRRELQATCGAAGLHAYVPAFGDVIDTRTCRLCGALEPKT